MKMKFEKSPRGNQDREKYYTGLLKHFRYYIGRSIMKDRPMIDYNPSLERT